MDVMHYIGGNGFFFSSSFSSEVYTAGVLLQGGQHISLRLLSGSDSCMVR